MPIISASSICQLKITVGNPHRPIWRRVLTQKCFNLYNLHKVIQLATGWADSHLHQFIIDGKSAGTRSCISPASVDKENIMVNLGTIINIQKNCFVITFIRGDFKCRC
jgi:Plasmid pRiA4b ORF-3-like protein